MAIYNGNQKISLSGISKCYVGNMLVYEDTPAPTYDFFYVEAINACDVALNAYGTPSTTPVLYYSTNKSSWTSYTIGDTVSISAGNKLYWKGTNSTFAGSTSNYHYFTFSDNVNVGGDITTLLAEEGNVLTLSGDYTFYYLFKNCSSLINVSNLLLTSTTLANYCYYNLFNGCTSITTPPTLPATTLRQNCYQGMFSGCTSLTTAPALPVMTLKSACYNSMFMNCTSLTSTPTLPATTLDDVCYYKMFMGCTNLTTLTTLPALEVSGCITSGFGYGAYQSMFRGCISLTSIPELPATTITDGYRTIYPCGAYVEMFEGCTGLTSITLNLPCTEPGKYAYASMFADCTNLTTVNLTTGITNLTSAKDDICRDMFNGCSSLNNITVNFQYWDTSTSDTAPTYEWVDGVSSTGTFNCSGPLVEQYDTTHVPTNWTIVKPKVVLTLENMTSSYGTLTGGGTYNEYSSVTLTATANSGYIFNYWQRVSTSTTYYANPLSITLTNSDETIYGTFRVRNNYTITTAVSPSEGGTATGGGTYAEQTSITLVATANEGYNFDHWELNGSSVSTSSSYTITVTGNNTYTAVFVARGEPHTWTILSGTTSAKAYILYNGTQYHATGTVISITDGDNISFVTGSSAYGWVVIDGTTVQSRAKGISYSYTPTSDASVVIQGNVITCFEFTVTTT